MTKQQYSFLEGNLYRLDCDDDVQAGQSFSYGDLDPSDDGTYLMHPWLGGSDYSGATVSLSNYQVFIERFGEVDGVHEVYGGHGTYGVAIRLDALTPDMIEVFEGLENYPLINEDHHSELELELQEEAWDNWTCDAFHRALQKAFPDHEDAIEEMDGGRLYELFSELAERSNTYWEHREGEGACIRLNDIVAAAELSDITGEQDATESEAV